MERIPAVTLAPQRFLCSKRILFESGEHFGFALQGTVEVVGIIDALILEVLSVARPSEGLAVEIEAFTLELPADNRDGPWVVPRAFPEASYPKQEVFEGVAGKFFSR